MGSLEYSDIMINYQVGVFSVEAVYFISTAEGSVALEKPYYNRIS